jgi:hypothetical protein
MSILAPAVSAAQQPAAGKPTAAESEELAKKLSNPISDLVSVPFQFNWYQNVGPLELSTFILNVQPVIPLELNDHWNLILRIIVPFIGQPPLFRGDVSRFGIGDMTTSFFFSPKSTSGFTWGWVRCSRRRQVISQPLAVDATASARPPSRFSRQESGRLEHCGIRCGRLPATDVVRT